MMSSKQQKVQPLPFQQAHDWLKMSVYDYHEVYCEASNHIGQIFDLHKIEARPFPDKDAIELFHALGERCTIAGMLVKAIDEELKHMSLCYSHDELVQLADDVEAQVAQDELFLKTIEKNIGHIDFRPRPKF